MDIRIKEDLTNSAQYDATDNIMYIKDPNNVGEALDHEMLHVYQDQVLDNLDHPVSHSNSEFQADFITKYIMRYAYYTDMDINTISSDKVQITRDWLNEYIIKTASGYSVNTNGFKDERLNLIYEGYRDYYKQLAADPANSAQKQTYERYSEAPDPNYDWKWVEVLDFMNIKHN